MAVIILKKLKLKDIKNIPLLLIPYLTVCGALYHISYWDRFGLNGLSLISITEIIKSSIYPIFTILIAVIYNLTIQNLILPTNIFKSQNTEKKRITNTNLLLIYLCLGLIQVLIFYFLNYKKPDKFLFIGLLNGIFISVFLINNEFLTNQFSTERIRRLAIDLIVFIPVVAFYSGKYKAEIIYQNLEYKYIISGNKNPKINLNSVSEKLKFIGNTEKHFVFTDLKNSKIIFFKSDNINELILYDKK